VILMYYVTRLDMLTGWLILIQSSIITRTST